MGRAGLGMAALLVVVGTAFVGWAVVLFVVVVVGLFGWALVRSASFDDDVYVCRTCGNCVLWPDAVFENGAPFCSHGCALEML